MTHSPFELHELLREGTPVVPLLSRRCMVGGTGGQIFSGEPGVVVRRAPDIYGMLSVRFANGASIRYLPHEVAVVDQSVCPFDLRSGIVLTTRIGSRAHGIARPDSDDDLRGVFVAPPDLHWSIMATPRRIEYLRSGVDELYYEIEGFVRRLLTGDPMAIETLFSHDVVATTPTGEYLLARKQEFLTCPAMLGFPTFLRSATRKLQTQYRRGKVVKPKAMMHWLRLGLSALRAIQTGEMTLEAREYAGTLIEIREGKWPYERVFEEVYKTLRQIRDALDHSPLPHRPALQAADECLIFARAEAAKSWLERNQRVVSVAESFAKASAEARVEAMELADKAWAEREAEVADEAEIVYLRSDGSPGEAADGGDQGHASSRGSSRGNSRKRRRRRGRSSGLAAPLAAIDAASARDDDRDQPDHADEPAKTEDRGPDASQVSDAVNGAVKNATTERLPVPPRVAAARATEHPHRRNGRGGRDHHDSERHETGDHDPAHKAFHDHDSMSVVEEALEEATGFARAVDAPRRSFMVLTEGENMPARVVYVSTEGLDAINGNECGEAMVEGACGWKEGPGRSPSRKARKRRGDWEDDEDWNEGATGEGEGDESGDDDEDSDGEADANQPPMAEQIVVPKKLLAKRGPHRGGHRRDHA